MSPIAVSTWAYHAARAGGCFLLAHPAQTQLLARLCGIEAAPYIDADIHHDVRLFTMPQLGGAWYDIPVQLSHTRGMARP